MKALILNIFLAGATFLLTVPAYAQVAAPAAKNQGSAHFPSGKKMSLYEQFTKQKTARKTTTDNTTRLIGLAYLAYDGTAYVIRDSTAYSYSNGRGSGSYELNNFDMSGSFTHLNCDSNHYYQYRSSKVHTNV